MNTASIDARTLMVRCLNETRLLHPPTYVAARYLAGSIAAEADSAWTPQVILRRFPLQEKPRLFEVVRIKKVTSDGFREYRTFHIPSPFTCLAEAVSLS